FADTPFPNVRCRMVVTTQSDRIGHAGVTTGQPVFDVVDIAKHRRNSTAWGLASTIPGQNRTTLSHSEESFRAFLIEHSIGAVPQLSDQLTITRQEFSIRRVYRPVVHGFSTIRGPRKPIEEPGVAVSRRLP